jgi:hypothetical protein
MHRTEGRMMLFIFVIKIVRISMRCLQARQRIMDAAISRAKSSTITQCGSRLNTNKGTWKNKTKNLSTLKTRKKQSRQRKSRRRGGGGGGGGARGGRPPRPPPPPPPTRQRRAGSRTEFCGGSWYMASRPGPHGFPPNLLSACECSLSVT